MISGVNRIPNDVDMSIKVDMINLNVHDIEKVNELFELEKNYQKNHNNDVIYQWFPRINVQDISNGYNELMIFQSYNSNSFAHGLLEAAGISVQKLMHILPGWNSPLPVSFFEL